MLKSKEVNFPQPLRTIVEGILQAAKEESAKHPFTETPDDVILSLIRKRADLQSRKPAHYPRVVCLKLPYISTELPANELLQRRFVGVLGIPEDWQSLLTNRPQCTSISAWGDGKRVFCSVIRNQEPLWIKSNGRKNTEEFLLLSHYPGVAADLRFYPPIGDQDTPIEQLISSGEAVTKTSALFSPDLLLGRFLNRLQTPVGRDRFRLDLSQRFLKS